MPEPAPQPPTARTQEQAVASMVRIGQARAYLDTALDALHAAMAVTPLVGDDTLGQFNKAGEMVTSLLMEHRVAIGDLYTGARAVDTKRRHEQAPPPDPQPSIKE